MAAVFILLGVLVTSLISGIFGMAGGFLFMGILSALVAVPVAMVIHGVVQCFANGLRAWTLKDAIVWRSTLLYFLGALSSFAVLHSLLWAPSKAGLFIGLGLIPYLALILRRWPLNFARSGHALACGFLVNALQVSAGVGGPALDVFFLRTSFTRFQIVATKSITQVMSHLLKAIFYWQAFQLAPKPESLEKLGVWFWPIALVLSSLGTLLGVQILARISDRNFLRGTQILVLSLGAIYFVKGLWLLW